MQLKDKLSKYLFNLSEQRKVKNAYSIAPEKSNAPKSKHVHDVISIPSSFLRKLLLCLAGLPFVIFAVWLLVLPFFKTSLLVGWDTPDYLYSVKILAVDGIGSFLKFWIYNRYVYSLILYPFYLASPNSLFVVARVLPVALSLSSIFLVGLLLSKWFKDNVIALLGVIFSCVWIAPYILASNLFDQLLTFFLILIWLMFAFKPQKRKVQILLYIVFFVAAISHVYTVIFLYIAFLLSYLTVFVLEFKDKNQSKIIKKTVAHFVILGCLIATPLIMSTALTSSLRIFGTLMNPHQMQETVYSPIAGGLVFISFGGNALYILPFAILVVVGYLIKTDLHENKLKYSFILWWATLALCLLPVSYIFPFLVSLTERMIIIFPVPILLALFARRLQLMISKLLNGIQGLKLRTLFRSPLFKGVIIASIAIPLFIVNINPITTNASLYSQAWLTQETSSSLQWISQNMRFAQEPLFVIDSTESIMAGQIDLWDNAIGAYVGPHYTYVGPIGNLINMRLTIFSSSQCNFYSQEYFNQLNASGILSYEGLNRTIILLDGFYNIQQDEEKYVQSIAPGISTVIFEKLWTDRNQMNDVTLNAYADATEKLGPWYGVARNWSSNPYVLELYSNITNQELLNYRFYIYASANYSINVRYFDFSGYNNSIDFKIDNQTVYALNYTGTEQPVETTVAVAYLANGLHDISIQPKGNGPMIIDLDYITIQYDNPP